MNVNDLQFNNKFVDFKSRNDKKNVNYLIDDNAQKTCHENIFYFNANLMLQKMKELTIIIYFLISSFDI